MNVPALMSATIIHIETCHTEFVAAFVSINATVCCGPWDQQIAYSEQAKLLGIFLAATDAQEAGHKGKQISVMKCSPTDGIHCLDYCGAAYPAEGMQPNVRSP